MRKTRPEDYDPTYKKKRAKGPKPEAINTEGIVPIKPKPSPAPSDADDEDTAERTHEAPDRTGVRTDERTADRPNDRTVERERSTKRHAFEIYRDQLERLKRLKAMAMLEGEDTSMSQMVRDALDTFLDKHGGD